MCSNFLNKINKLRLIRTNQRYKINQSKILMRALQPAATDPHQAFILSSPTLACSKFELVNQCKNSPVTQSLIKPQKLLLVIYLLNLTKNLWFSSNKGKKLAHNFSMSGRRSSPPIRLINFFLSGTIFMATYWTHKYKHMAEFLLTMKNIEVRQKCLRTVKLELASQLCHFLRDFS